MDQFREIVGRIMRVSKNVLETAIPESESKENV